MGWGRLRYDDFAALLNTNPQLDYVKFDCFGEAFLNKELPAMLELGAKRGIRFRITSANFNYISEQTINALVSCQVERISVAIDGISQASYGEYRRGGNLETVLENIRKLNAAKQAAGSELPHLEWLWVVFGHNQHEIGEARRLAEELGMTFRAKMQWDESYSPIRDREQLERELGWIATDRKELASSTGRDYMADVCHQLWLEPKINWDGKVLGCCWTQEGFESNAFEEGYLEAVNGDKISYARAMLRGEAPPRDDIPCSRCPQYLGRARSGTFISTEELEAGRKSIGAPG